MFRYLESDYEFVVTNNSKGETELAVLETELRVGNTNQVTLSAELEAPPQNKDGFWIPMDKTHSHNKFYIFITEEGYIKKRQFLTTDGEGKKYAEFFLTPKGREHIKGEKK